MAQEKNTTKKTENSESGEGRMSFFSHLEEARSRLVFSLVVFFIGFLICYTTTNPWVFDFLKAPLFQIMPEGQQKLYFTSLFENFLTHLKIGAVSAIFFLSPFFFYQLWAFIRPGLYPRERKLVVPFVLAATLFFLGGAAFAYYILFPVAFKFFVTFGADTDIPLLTIRSYFDTCLKLLLLFGLAFELPVLIIFLGFMGVLDAEMLRTQRRAAIIGITIACAMFAPPDAISMIILMVPLILLYEAAIIIVDWWGPGRKKRREQGDPLKGESMPEAKPPQSRSKKKSPRLKKK